MGYTKKFADMDSIEMLSKALTTPGLDASIKDVFERNQEVFNDIVDDETLVRLIIEEFANWAESYRDNPQALFMDEFDPDSFEEISFFEFILNVQAKYRMLYGKDHPDEQTIQTALAYMLDAAGVE